VCDLETSRMGAPYIYDISHLRVNWNKMKRKSVHLVGYFYVHHCLLKENSSPKPPMRLWIRSIPSLMAHMVAINVWSATGRLWNLDIFTDWPAKGYLWTCSHRLFLCNVTVRITCCRPFVSQAERNASSKMRHLKPFPACNLKLPNTICASPLNRDWIFPMNMVPVFLTISWIPDSTD